MLSLVSKHRIFFFVCLIKKNGSISNKIGIDFDHHDTQHLIHSIVTEYYIILDCRTIFNEKSPYTF